MTIRGVHAETNDLHCGISGRSLQTGSTFKIFPWREETEKLSDRTKNLVCDNLRSCHEVSV